MNPVSVDIKDILVAKGLGVFASTSEQQWGIYVSQEPPTPDNTITVYDLVGTADKVYSGGANHFLHSPFQLRVRGTSYLTAYEKMEACRKALDRYGRFTVGTVSYTNVLMDPTPLPLGKDDNSRHIFTLDGTAFRQDTA